jgi:hypothetical protein
MGKRNYSGAFLGFAGKLQAWMAAGIPVAFYVDIHSLPPRGEKKGASNRSMAV